MSQRLPSFETTRLKIEHARVEHAVVTADFFRRNAEHLRPWQPPRSDGVATAEFWRERLPLLVDQFERGIAASFHLFALEDADATALLGTVNFSQIARGPFQSCMVGYQLDAAQQCRGLMTEALSACVRYAFDELGLHRVQANYIPTNTRSEKVLRAVGFATEGLARNYLYIDGAWRDHVMTAIINPNSRAPTS